MPRAFILLLIICFAFLAVSMFVHAVTIGDVLQSPVPSPGTFVPNAFSWLSSFWQKLAAKWDALLAAPVNNSVVSTVIAIAKWFWRFTVSSLWQGWNSLVALIRMAIGASGVDLTNVRWPWQ